MAAAARGWVGAVTVRGVAGRATAAAERGWGAVARGSAGAARGWVGAVMVTGVVGREMAEGEMGWVAAEAWGCVA